MHLEPLFKEALESSVPAEALRNLARGWRDQGMPQASMYSAFEEQLVRQSGAESDRLYDALAETMDLIVGWCTPSAALYGPRNPESNGSS